MKGITHDRKIRRVRRVRSRIIGTQEIPRISVYRSNKYFYAQAIDDQKRTTLSAASSFSLGKKNKQKIKKSEEAGLVGKQLAQQLVKKGIKKGVLDRGRYAYLGRVKSFATGLREGGLGL